MDRLPYEILKEIFILLPQHQKVECMCVCRSWEKVIKDACLFHTVLITTHENLDKLIRVFECTPSNGAHVKRLILYISRQNSFFMMSFLAFFPNLKSFYYYGKTDLFTTMSSIVWEDNRSKALKNKPLAGVSRDLLISNMFSHLKILDLNLNHTFTTSSSPLLINAPNLVHLTLKGYRFRYKEVEQFDNSFPLLETVKFWIIVSISAALPEEIKPNSRITCIHFKLKSISMAGQVTLLRYISKKYTNLIGFAYDTGEPQFTEPLRESPSSTALKDTLLSTIVCQGPQLKTLKVLCTRLDFSHLTNSIVSFQLEKCNLDFTQISPEQLFLKNSFFKSTFCKLRVLTIQFISTSNFKWLEALDRLEVLKIKHPRLTHLRLDSVMQHISHTIETLVIKGCLVEIGQDYLTLGLHEKSKIDQGESSDCSYRIYPLKKLKLSHIRISENVDNFIFHTCPGLQSLSIYSCSIDNLEFKLPNTHLLHFNIITERPRYGSNKGKHWDCIWIHTKEDSCLWRIDHSHHNYYRLNYFEFYGFPALPVPMQIPNNTLRSVDICNFTFASVKRIGFFFYENEIR